MELMAYLGLFAAAFVAATLLPAQSELLLGGMIASGDYSVPLLLLAATVGNILGSTVNWVLGRYFYHLRERRWFPIKKAQLEKAGHWYHKYGRWSLLLSWMPVVGDPITLVAGILREPFPSFIAIVAVAKTLRYIVVALITLQFT